MLCPVLTCAQHAVMTHEGAMRTVCRRCRRAAVAWQWGAGVLGVVHLHEVVHDVRVEPPGLLSALVPEACGKDTLAQQQNTLLGLHQHRADMT